MKPNIFEFPPGSPEIDPKLIPRHLRTHHVAKQERWMRTELSVLFREQWVKGFIAGLLVFAVGDILKLFIFKGSS